MSWKDNPLNEVQSYFQRGLNYKKQVEWKKEESFLQTCYYIITEIITLFVLLQNSANWTDIVQLQLNVHFISL